PADPYVPSPQPGTGEWNDARGARCLSHRHRQPGQRPDKHQERTERMRVTRNARPLERAEDRHQADDQKLLPRDRERQRQRPHHDPALRAGEGVKAARAVELPEGNQIEEIDPARELRDRAPDWSPRQAVQITRYSTPTTRIQVESVSMG